ncbi:MAG: glycosyl hydrolase family 28-related protein [Ferruginibacter sp.]
MPITSVIKKAALLFLLPFFCLYSNAQVEYKNIKTDFGARGNGKLSDHAAFRRAAAYINKRKGNVVLFIPKGTYLLGQRILKPLHIVNKK